ncbi:LANO_0C05292g1_1 [Lachancea nothofagi CBS 11611]|uniref:Golgi apparatus membrane protein TVP23 n=1 Tax=Lachancea nothofagi CBS 11611 TaxID=1266666 RepID=A0A1G4J7B5_9SACH|nr:LANO_0C05292g1_1 [Lachancea nothofagi CBS 11611]
MDHVKNFYQMILKSSHPITMSLHLLGKSAPIVLYLAGSLFMSFTAQFIAVLLLLAGDFYVTKNITGRKLVQLRWWYDSVNSEEGPLSFESYKQFAPGPPINPIDSKLFWISLYVAPALWIVFGIMCLLQAKFLYLILIGMAVCLTGWNAHGFRNCDKWDPSANNSESGTWLQMPNMASFENLGRLARIQNLFRSN